MKEAAASADETSPIMAILQMEEFCSWGKLLEHAPLVIAFLGQLLEISTKTDFSLDAKTPEGGFKHLKYPHSFRASLVQVSNLLCETIMKADRSMKTLSFQIDDFVSTSEMVHECVKYGTKNDKQQLQLLIDDLKLNLDKCRENAKETEDNFSSVVNILNEMSIAITVAKGSYETYAKETNAKKESLKIEKLKIEEMIVNMKRTKPEISSKLAKAESSFEMGMKNVPETSTLSAFKDVDPTLNFEGEQMINIFPISVHHRFIGSMASMNQSKRIKLDKIIDTAENKVKLRKEMLSEAKREYEKYLSMEKETDDHQVKVLQQLAKLKFDRVNFDQIEMTLQKVFRSPVSLQHLLAILLLFFSNMTNCLESVLQLTCKIEKHAVNKPRSRIPFVLETCGQVECISYGVSLIANSYKKISNNFLLPNVSKLNLMINFDPETQDEQLKDARRTLMKEQMDAVYEIKRFAGESRRNLMLKIIQIDRELQKGPKKGYQQNSFISKKLAIFVIQFVICLGIFWVFVFSDSRHLNLLFDFEY